MNSQWGPRLRLAVLGGRPACWGEPAHARLQPELKDEPGLLVALSHPLTCALPSLLTAPIPAHACPRRAQRGGGKHRGMGRARGASDSLDQPPHDAPR